MNKIEHIDELISKFFSGEATPEEAILIEEWKDEKPEHLTYFIGCEKLFVNTGGKQVDPNSKAAWEKVRTQLQSGNKIKPLYKPVSFIRIAATIALLIGLSGIAIYFLKENHKQELAYTSGKQTKEIKLEDGTDVKIAPNSSLTIDENFGKKNRTLHLKGEAYFSVVHKEELPFIIDVGNIFIKDIGTKFNVRSSVDTDTVYVNVFEGVVLLFDSLGSELEIKATENAIYIRSKKQIINLTETAEQNRELNFSNSRLEEVIKILNKKYNTTILVENSKLNQCKITTKFEQEDLQTVLGIITETLGLSYEKTAGGYIIKGQACQP